MPFKHFVALLTAATLFPGTVTALEYHGYGRTGFGQSSAGGTQTCFQLPGAYTKYRLGNECETYGEFQLDQTVHEQGDCTYLS